MDLFLETRGSARTTGYRFLGAQPQRAWWLRRYGGRTSFERPTVLVESDPDGVRAYLGAIPSGRRDTEGATNRVTIVVESTPITDDEDRQLVARLVAAWVGDIGTGGRALPDALDEAFDEDTVTRLYAGTDSAADEVGKRILDAASSLPPGPAAGTDPAPFSWIAPTRSARARTAFVERVDELLSGRRTGIAVLVNLVGEESAFAAEAGSGAAVLTAAPAEDLTDELRPMAHRPRSREVAEPAEHGRRTPGKALAVLFGGTARKVAWAILALAIVAVTIAVRARSGPEPGPPPGPATTAPAVSATTG